MNKSIPLPPEPPEDYECCQNGCDELCVFEIYRQQKADYEQKYGSPKGDDDSQNLAHD